MTSDQIHMFLSAAKTLNFTETANEFHTTQPTVSRQIHWLEEEWGVKLFEQVKKKMFLSPEGVIMLNKCQIIEEVLKVGLNEAKNVKNGYTGTLKIGFLETIDENEIINLVEQFEQKYPGIQVQIQEASFGQLRKSLDEGKTDLIFTLDFEAYHLKNVVGEMFRKTEPVFVISKKHPLYEKTELSFRDFEHIEFVFPDAMDSPGRGETALTLFKNLGLNGNHIMTAQNLKTVLYYVRSGRAAALLDSSIREIRREEFRVIKLPEGIVPALEIMAFWKKDNLNPCIPLLYNSELF